MCGLVGYIGNSACKELLLKGLSRLEYRGYDSAGLALLVPHEHRLRVVREVGELARLSTRLQDMNVQSTVGIGHTRWATHGEPSLNNCHPQLDCQHAIAVIHNGIIENFLSLKKMLEKEHVFSSATDTEVVAHLLESLLLVSSTLHQALVACVGQLEGSYALAILMRAYPEVLIAIRKRSPLYIGIGGGQHYIASDQRAFAGEAHYMVVMPDESFAFVSKDTIELFDFSGRPLSLVRKPVTVKEQDITSNGFAHFMLKEIYEQKSVIHRSVQEYSRLADQILDQMGLSRDDIMRFSSLQIIACGSSWHAGLLAKFFFEEIAHLKTDVHLASEFRYARFWFDPTALYVAISQSGETADTLEALRMVKHAGGRVVSLINVAMSTMVEESNGFLEIFAGPEIAVASTKAFSAQVTALYYIAHFFARMRGVLNTPPALSPEQELRIAAQALEDGIEIYKDDIQQVLAPRYTKYHKMLFVGRQESYVMAQEAALKLKEISYIFADALPAGELKHGSIALVDRETPVVLFSSLRPRIYQKLLLSAQEIKARPSHLVVYAFEGQQELIDVADHAFVLPRVTPLLGPLAQTGLMHYIAYEIARQLDRPIDKPRNLAKSVTVE